MKGWIIKGLITVVAMAAFPVALYTVLAMQGRLTSPDIEMLRNVPLVGDLIPPAEEVHPKTTTPTKPVENPFPTRRPDWRDSVAIEDPESLVEELKARRAVYDAKLDELQKERLTVERRKAELDGREDILAGLQEQIEMGKADLARERRQMEERGKLIDAGAAKALKDTAKTIAEMDAEKAAEAMTALDEDRAAKLLKVMDASAAATILSEMKDADRRRTMIEKLTILQTEPTKKKKGAR